MKEFRVVVAGGREFNNYHMLKTVLDHLLHGKLTSDKVIIVCGGARGADKLGERYAKERGLEINYYLADWDKHGKSAGYKRNAIMADNSDATVAFWDGKSRGTKHMIDLTSKAGNLLRTVYYDRDIC